MPNNFAVDERLELLRDQLRQAAVHSPSSRTRWAAAACLNAPDATTMLRLVKSLSCTYAPGLRRAVAEFWEPEHA